MADSKKHLTDYSFLSSPDSLQPSLSQNQRSLRYSIKMSIIFLSSIPRSELAVWKSASSWHVLRNQQLQKFLRNSNATRNDKIYIKIIREMKP